MRRRSDPRHDPILVAPRSTVALEDVVPEILRAAAPDAVAEPLRAELFGVERLEQLATELALSHRIDVKRRNRRPLLARLEENGRVLLASYRAIALAIREERAISPAAEWLVDNFHIVEDQLREIREDLPPAFYRQLPLLTDDPALAPEHSMAGYPRVYGLSWSFVEHSDSRIDIEILRRFVRAYQNVQPLTMGELWAVPISLRLILVENLRRLTEHIVRRRAEREAADEFADALLGIRGAKETAEAALAHIDPSALPSAFAVQLLQRLRDRDPTRTPAMAWLNERLTAQGRTADEMVSREHHTQVATHVSVRNVISSMRLLSAVDWTVFFEAVSLVDGILRERTRVGEMNFATRDRYRHAIEELARGSRKSEIDVSRRAVDLAHAGAGAEDVIARERGADPGTYILGSGRLALERELGYRPRWKQRLARAYEGAGLFGYVSAIGVLTLALVGPASALTAAGGASLATVITLGLLACIPAIGLAVALVNRHVLAVLAPRSLPKLELEQGVPTELRTLVVVPTLLRSEEQVREQVARLEVHFLSNPDGDLRFALLSDGVDALAEMIPEDERLFSVALEAVTVLNRTHGPAPGGGARFLLLHRRRLWNAGEGRWMGWERKRGKLCELNRLLRGATDTSFIARRDAASQVPHGVRFVITLDADTRLPIGAARRLVGTLAHPLNQPRFDPTTRRVVEGYGVLQPRITATLPATDEGTLFQRIFAGTQGIDPYAFAVSDVYQDLFGWGIFTGKGIYDVDAFSSAIDGRVPENALLSHDLFEGLFARAGLVTDIELFDEYPAHYGSAAARAERWTRGDWQLLPWLSRRIHDAVQGRIANPIPALGRFQVLDNMRRSLAAPMTVLLLLAAWLLPDARAWLWTLLVLAIGLVPSFLPALSLLVPRRSGIGKRSFARRIRDDLVVASAQAGLGFVLLGHQAWLMTQAIARTWSRLFTRRRLLAWVSAAQAGAESRLDLPSFVRSMWPAMTLAIIAFALTLARQPANMWLALPWVGAWFASPWVARWISLPPRARAGTPLSARDIAYLRLTARRTWRFFETCVGAEDHHLPPDNLQEDPHSVRARRTSPTNVGVYLLSVVSARDLGWIGTGEMVERLDSTLTTLERLERFRGHFLNWYSTADLSTLLPKYVSTVDSGNLVAHLLALKQAALELRGDQPSPERAIAGLRDVLTLVREALRVGARDRREGSVTWRELEGALDAIEHLVLQPADAAWRERVQALERSTATLNDVIQAMSDERADDALAEALVWVRATQACVASHARDLDANHAARLTALAARAQALVATMQFGFLFDPVRKLFSIGYRLEDGHLDPGYYDLLASEARIASLVAIARGEVPPEHWFRLGRPLIPLGRGLALASWSGSMFEYLMPELVLRVPDQSLLQQTVKLVVAEQMRYAAMRDVPWGISESAFSARDVELTYQYKAFGVPGLGLKRGLGDELVIAPYATALAAMVDPAAAVRNFEELAREGGLGSMGFYEAIDYTRSRLPENERSVVVRAYMAHHQGMTVLALANVVTGGKMRDRFHAEPLVQAADLLLQERTPHGVAVSRPRAQEIETDLRVRDFVPPVLRRFSSPHDLTPRTHLLSNGRYAVMLTTAGSGYSRWNELAITRWREDPTRDPWGNYVFVSDVNGRRVWSAGYQPSAVEPDAYEVAYYEDRAEIHRRDGTFATALEVVVSPEDDAEVRQVSVTNLGLSTREIELTSYSEIVLASPEADSSHPAFSKLFVETEFVPHLEALLASRRPRSAQEPRMWAAHVMAFDAEPTGAVQFETDRARFVGRGRTIRNASSVRDGRPLSGTVGSVLDPIFSLRRRFKLAPGASVRATFSTLIAPTREQALALVDRYRQVEIFERTANLAWTQAQVQLRHLGIDAEEAHVFQRVATRILYSDPSLRPPPEALQANQRGASGLWAHRISGDIAIVVARVANADDLDLARQVLRASEYWRLKGLAVDVVILNEEAHGYAADLQAKLESLVRARAGSQDRERKPQQGSVFLLRADQMSAEDKRLLLSAARVVLDARNGTLSEQIMRLLKKKAGRATELPVESRKTAEEISPPRLQLEFWNGLGGFADGGREYVIVLGEGQWTPAPWINVVAQPGFGFQVSESGSGYTWAGNSRENQITAWSNDPISDPPGEALFVRDEETGELWGPTALPIRETTPYVARHGQGYSKFSHESHGISLELVQFVPLSDPVKVSRLTLENRTKRRRFLSVTAYVEWVLGPMRERGAPFIVTQVDTETGALLARNPWNEEWSTRVAFMDLGGEQSAWTADRTEFLGRNGNLERPAGLARGAVLSGSTGAGLDPCGALQAMFELAPLARVEIVFVLGEALNADVARQLVSKYRTEDLDQSLARVRTSWDDVLGALEVKTPDRSFDLLLNRWLLYQSLACRVWARSAFYQSGGAFGFRDQLQDVMALCVARPDAARTHILYCAGRQFVEGDVQHWWHEPSGRGVRTRISDDLLWLSYAALHYSEVTGDRGIFDARAPFLTARELDPEEHDRYFAPELSADAGTLFEHCARSLDRSLTRGAHGLPLIGAGDWNDGMNRVGHRGRGESIWLGWFMHTLLWEFARIAEGRGELERATRWRAYQADLKVALERDGWDGDWYRRAYFDDGTPLGSASSEECRIDSIAQTWAVISGAADPARAAHAMAAVEEHLVRRGDGLILLFTPPFDRTPLDPGYIKGYLPGVRENGGQYTHAAVWTVIAFAALAQGDKASELFGILNPINQSSTRAGMHRYKVEPYVMAADVYSQPPHLGRGGWTWYTGSASWMYRAGVEWILGFRLRGNVLHIDPCIPRAWPFFEISFRYHSAVYQLRAENPHGVTRGVTKIELDGREIPPVTREIALAADGKRHAIRIVLG